MVSFNPKTAAKIYNEIASQTKPAKTAAELAQEARELSMIPKYLELASLKGKNRFNAQEVKGLTKNFESYETGLSKTDLLKDLLAIGSENGKTLNADEITGFLKATSSLNEKEQKNVLKFLKAAKEADSTGEKITLDGIRKKFTFEEFKKHEIDINKDTEFVKRNPNFLSEKELQERYEVMVNNEYRIASNEYYNNARSINKTLVSEFITKNSNPIFIKAVAESKDPEVLAKIINETGVTDLVSASADSLVDAYKLSSGNMNLVTDLSRAFYPAESKEIVELLSKETGRDWSSYRGFTSRRHNDGLDGLVDSSLNSQRRTILKKLDLTGKIKLIQLGSYRDVYAFSTNGSVRGNKISGGSYERGKKQ